MSVPVSGQLRLEGRPLSGQDVLVLGPGARGLLGAGATDDGGAFEVALDDGDAHDGPLTVLWRVRNEVLAVAAATVEPGGTVELEMAGPLHELTATIESEAGYPEVLDVFLEPSELEGVPANVMPFLTQEGPGVFASRFVRRAVKDRTLRVRLQRGSWRVGGDFIISDRPNLVQRDFRNYIVSAVRRESGEELRGDPSAGFSFDVDGDLALTLVLRELRDDEL